MQYRVHVDIINLKIDNKKSPTYTIVVIHRAGSIRIKDCTFNKYKDIDIEQGIYNFYNCHSLYIYLYIWQCIYTNI